MVNLRTEVMRVALEHLKGCEDPREGLRDVYAAFYEVDEQLTRLAKRAEEKARRPKR